MEYKNVLDNKDFMELMLKYSKGNRNVPVIVIDNKVQIGYGGT